MSTNESRLLQMYESEIESVDTSEDRAEVRFLGFGNEETMMKEQHF